MSANLKLIAEKLNISIATVSRVVNNKSFVNEKTRQRVLRALEEYEYVPNIAARNLRVNATNSLGLVVPDICDAYWAQVVKTVCACALAEGYVMSLGIADSPEAEREYLEMFLSKRVDVLVTCFPGRELSLLRRYSASGIPVIVLGDISGEDISADCICADDAAAGELAVRNLLKKGNKKIAFIASNRKDQKTVSRMNGCKNALIKAAQIPDEKLIKYAEPTEDAGYDSMCALLESESIKFTAVGIVSEVMAAGALRAISESGLAEELDIVVFNTPINERFTRMITVIQPEENILDGLKDTLERRITEKRDKTEPSSPKRIVLPSRLQSSPRREE